MNMKREFLILLVSTTFACATTDVPPEPLVPATLIVKEPIQMTLPLGTEDILAATRNSPRTRSKNS